MENENPTPNNTPNPLENALKQIQAWFVDGEFEKVKRGCEEILKVAPNNSIAQDLLKKADEAMNKPPMEEVVDTAPAVEEDAPFPTAPTTPTPPPPIPTGMPSILPDPIPPMPESIAPRPIMTPPAPMEEVHHGHSLLVNVGILIGLILLGIGAVYGYSAFFGDKEEEKTPENIEQTEETVQEETEEVIEEEIVEETELISEEDPTIDARNEKRLTDLTTVEKALIEYYDVHKNYPSPSEVNTVLVEEGLIQSIPIGPNPGEVYVYAVYGNPAGENQVYVLSAQFENQDGSTSAWTTGANLLDYPDYSDISQEEVTLLHPNMTEQEYLDWLAKTANENAVEQTEETTSEEEEEEPVRVPRT